MKRIYTLCLLIGMSFSFLAQEIPNGNFETWGLYNTWTYTPESWSTSNGQLMAKVTIDSMAYEGDKAMKVETGAFNNYGFARIGLTTNAVPDKLDFYAKAEFEGYPALSVSVSFFNEGTWVTGASWYPNEELNDWTLVEIYMPIGETDWIVDSLEISVEAISGDFAYGEGWVSLDAMNFSNVQSTIEKQELTSWNIFPNPVMDKLNLQIIGINPKTIEIIDMSGRLVVKSDYQESLMVKQLESGFYLVRLIDDRGIFYTKRIEKY